MTRLDCSLTRMNNVRTRTMMLALFAILVSASGPGRLHAQGKPEAVSFATADMVNIGATWYPTRPGAPAVICLHQWRADRSSFEPLALALQKEGIAVLCIDLRGFGDSKTRRDGSSVAADRNARKDVEAAVRWVSEVKSVPRTSIALVGASYGSSNAIQHAAEDKAIAAVVMLSPGLNYFNVLPIEAAFRSYTPRPVLAVVSSEDLRSVEAVTELKGMGSSGLTTEVVDNAGHGTEMFRERPALVGTVVRWVVSRIRGK